MLSGFPYGRTQHVTGMHSSIVSVTLCFHTVFVWLTRSVNHAMSWSKIFIPGFVTVNRALVAWFAILKDRLQSTLG